MTQKLSIHILGICGTGVGALAGLLKQMGHQVRGSDENVYPPMSDKLREWGIPILHGYKPEHLEPKPDLVIVGNVIRATNPEAVRMRELALPHMSMPQAVAEFGIADKHSIVIAGTHGKTTVTALVAHILMQAGADPSFLVGGAMLGYPDSYRFGRGRFFVIEGDEYDTAYFDKGSKFLYYRPQTAVITSLEYDHADIFSDIGAVENAFAGLVRLVPKHGHIVTWLGAERARRIIKKENVGARVSIYSAAPHSDAQLYLESYTSGPEGLHFTPVIDGKRLGPMQVALWGDFSAANVLAALGALRVAELSVEQLQKGFATFRGVKRRLEVIGEPRGVTVVDDFGHHPTAVDVTLAAARTRWPGRRIWALFEPRSATSRRNVFQKEYVQALGKADAVIVGSHERLTEIEQAQRFDPEKLVNELGGVKKQAFFVPEVPKIVQHLQTHAGPGDVIIVFSNGAFGGLHKRLLEALGSVQKPMSADQRV